MAHPTHAPKPDTKSAPDRAGKTGSQRLTSFAGLAALGQAGVLGSTGLLGLQRSVGNQSALLEIDRPAPTTVSEFFAGPALQMPGQAQTSQRVAQTAYVGALQMSREATAAAAHTQHPHVQRHSSWEHALLGDAKPEVLGDIGTWQDLLSQTERVDSSGKVVSQGRTMFGDPKAAEATVMVAGKPVKKGNVMHDLAQEMSRLKKWQDEPPTKSSSEGYKVGADDEFGVTIVALPARDPAKVLMITYGELNTLADFYGDLKTMKTASPGKREEIVQSVRKETFLRLKQIYDTIEDSLTNLERKD